MFRGISKLTVDAKGRVAIPKLHRDRMESDGITGLVVTADSSKCLLIYSMRDYLEIEAKIISMPNTNPVARTLQRLYVGYASEVAFDTNGRILLSTELREYAGLNKKAVLIGQGKKCELWSDERFTAASEQWPDELNDRSDAETTAAIEALSI